MTRHSSLALLCAPLHAMPLLTQVEPAREPLADRFMPNGVLHAEHQAPVAVLSTNEWVSDVWLLATVSRGSQDLLRH